MQQVAPGYLGGDSSHPDLDQCQLWPIHEIGGVSSFSLAFSDTYFAFSY
jgi:hypothetical protein